MIHPNDEDTIRRMTGLEEMPLELATEYEHWLRMKHRNGDPGALGPSLLICLLRQVGFQPPVPTPSQDVVDWRGVALGTRLVVTASNGTFTGRYTGKVDYGTIGVQLDGTGFVQEVNVRSVKLADAVPGDLIEEPETGDEAVEVFGKDAVVDLDAKRPAIDWQLYKRGHDVWVDADGGILNGTFWQEKDGFVVVKVGSEKVCYDPSQVVPVEG